MLFDACERLSTFPVLPFMNVIEHSCVIILNEIPNSSVMNTTPVDPSYFDICLFEVISWEPLAVN